MTLNEAKENIERKQSKCGEEIEKYLSDIHTFTSERSLGKHSWIGVLYKVRSIMKKIEEADQEVMTYFSILDTLYLIEEDNK